MAALGNSLHPVPPPLRLPNRLATDRFEWILEHQRRSTGRFSTPISYQPHIRAASAHVLTNLVSPWDPRERCEIMVMKDVVATVGDYRHYGHGVFIFEETACIGERPNENGQQGPGSTAPVTYQNVPIPAPGSAVSIPVVSSVVVPRPPTPRPTHALPHPYSVAPYTLPPRPEMSPFPNTIPLSTTRSSMPNSVLMNMLSRRVIEHETAATRARERELALELELVYARREEERERRKRPHQHASQPENTSTSTPESSTAAPTPDSTTAAPTPDIAAAPTPDNSSPPETTPRDPPPTRVPSENTPTGTSTTAREPLEVGEVPMDVALPATDDAPTPMHVPRPPTPFGIPDLLMDKENQPTEDTPREASVQGEIPAQDSPMSELTPEPALSTDANPPTPERDNDDEHPRDRSCSPRNDDDTDDRTPAPGYHYNERPQEELPAPIPRYPFRTRVPRTPRAHFVLGDSVNGGRVLGRETRRIVTFRTEAPSLALCMAERAELDKLLNVRPGLWMPKEKSFVRAITRQLRRATAVAVGYGEAATAQPPTRSESMEVEMAA